MPAQSIDSEYERDRNNRRKAVSAEITYERLQVALIAAANVDDQEKRIDSKAQEEKIESLREKAYVQINELASKYLSPDQPDPEQSARAFRAACDLLPLQIWVENEQFGLRHLSCDLFVNSIWHQLAISENGQTYSLAEFAEQKVDNFEKERQHKAVRDGSPASAQEDTLGLPLYAVNIRFLRDRCGWSQEKLAKEVGIEKQSVSKHERGKATPHDDNLTQYASAFVTELQLPEITCYSLRTTNWEIELRKRT